MTCRVGLPVLLALVLAGALGATSATASGVPQDSSRPYHELVDEPRTFVATPGLAGEFFAGFLDDLQAKGVRVPVAIPEVGCVVIADEAARASLDGDPRSSFVRNSPFALNEQPAFPDPARAQGLVTWWNEGFKMPHAGAPVRAANDARICEGAMSLEDALASRGKDVRCSGPSNGRIHFASGRVIVNLVFPESEGGNTTANWTPAFLASIESELIRALHWWNLKTGGAVTFVLVNRGTAATTYEPGALMIGDEDLYLGDALASLGYDGICAYAQLDEMNEESRAIYHGNWAFTQVVIHADSFPGSGALAYAYLGGPHTVALSGNGYLGMERLDRVMAHEMGHIFQALDEYVGGCSDCVQRSGYLDTPNRNCVACQYQVGKCVMRGGSEYDVEEMNNMETQVAPCEFTLGMAGVRDANENGIIDVRETFPETEVNSAIPDTLYGSRNYAVQGRAWDLPYSSAPARYSPPVTLNSISGVEFSVDGRRWAGSLPLDGSWDSKDEEFELRLPETGGGIHRLWVRAVNSTGARDASGPKIDFFVYDVMLHDELETLQDGGDIMLTWRVNGEDLGSRFLVYRREDVVGGAEEALLTEVASRGVRNDKFVVRDANVNAGSEYLYRLEVDIPGKGRKLLGSARGKVYLADPPAGRFVILGPNPTSQSVLITVTVPRGPRPQGGGQMDPEEDPGGVLGPPGRSGDGVRGETDPGGSGDGTPLWRDVSLAVYDVTGRRIKDLGVNRALELTRFNVTWDGTSDAGRPVPPGTYFLRTAIGDTSESRRITIVR